MRLLYSAAISLFGIVLRLLAPFHTKSGLWVGGRRNWRKELQQKVAGENDLIWVHCSSLGEFEQGRPVIEALHQRGEKVLLTFFSPSGFENLGRFNKAVVTTYIPLDTRKNAKDFLNIVKPKAVAFVKYEFWFNFISEINKRHIPLILFSGIFRPDQYFFKSWGSWFAKQLQQINFYFAQNKASAELAISLGIEHVIVSGDTRFDRVSQIASENRKIEEFEGLSNDVFTIVAGSTWPEDEELLIRYCSKPSFNGRLILVPHHTDDDRIAILLKKSPEQTIRFSSYKSGDRFKFMIIDKMGMLSTLYRYGSVAYIGGGFGRGIHNSLEAAVYGVPVLFGPNYQKFAEAVDLINKGGAFSVKNMDDLEKRMNDLIQKETIRDKASEGARSYVQSKTGATNIILDRLSAQKIIHL